MYLIVGLGNIGEEYEKTRHNAGFKFVDKLAGEEQFLKNFTLVKPQTMMNDSGRAVQKMMNFYKLGIEDVVVVHDDLDIAFGEYKIQKDKGPKVHNGVLSVEQCLGRTDFWRVRIGIDNRQPGVNYGTGADYVLSNFSKQEVKDLDVLFEEIVKELAETLGWTK